MERLTLYLNQEPLRRSRRSPYLCAHTRLPQCCAVFLRLIRPVPEVVALPYDAILLSKAASDT